MLQNPQPFQLPGGVDANVVATHTVSMAGWALQAVMKNAATGAVATYVTGAGATVPVPTKTTGAGIALSDDAAGGVNTVATIDYSTAGEMHGLPDGVYRVGVRRTDAGDFDLLALLVIQIVTQDP